MTKNLLDNKLWLGFVCRRSAGHAHRARQPHGPDCCHTALHECRLAPRPRTVRPQSPRSTTSSLGAFGTSGGLYNPLGNYAFNLAPDLVFKAVFEPGFGHYEVFGVLSQFRDRVFPCVPITGTVRLLPGCSSITSAAVRPQSGSTGGGIGANARWALLNKKVDAGLHFLGGDGIGRYGSVGLSDATTRPNGTLALLRNYQALGTLQLHPMPKLDIYFNVGGEFSNARSTSSPGSVPNEGYGAVGFSNTGCWTETLPLTGPSTSTNSSAFQPASAARRASFPGPWAAARAIRVTWSKERLGSGIASTTARREDFSSARSTPTTCATPGAVSAPVIPLTVRSLG